MKIARESLIIIAIGIADLATTLYWVNHHGAQEANPLFRFYLAMGPVWFSAMKMIMLLGPVLLLEWARRSRPSFTRWSSRFAIAAYLGLYGVGVARLNPDLVGSQPAQAKFAMITPQDMVRSIEAAMPERAGLFRRGGDSTVRSFNAATPRRLDRKRRTDPAANDVAQAD